MGAHADRCRTEEARAASDAALERVYREHFNFVYRKAARLGGPHLDPDDVAQEVFLVVARRLHTFDGSSRMTTWLYGITFNVVRHMRRKAVVRRLFVDALASLHDPAPPVLDAAEVREAHRIAYEILDRMSPRKREVFILAELEGLTCEEIATLVSAKLQTVWSRLHYARKEFSERLERYRRRTADAAPALDAGLTEPAGP